MAGQLENIIVNSTYRYLITMQLTSTKPDSPWFSFLEFPCISRGVEQGCFVANQPGDDFEHLRVVW